MRLLITIAVTVALAALAGCERPLQLSGNRVFPSKPAFSITPEPASKDCGLDFDAVYYLANNEPPVGSGLGGNYYRFWSDGRVLFTFTQTDDPPSAAEADRFQCARLGYYRVRGNQVEIQIYAPNATGRSPYGVVGVHPIDKDGNLVGRLLSGTKDLGPIVYRRIPVEGMRRAPDW